jgi:hypothetical protein
MVHRDVVAGMDFFVVPTVEGHLAQATAFEVPLDPAAGIGENQEGIRNFAAKTTGWKDIRSRSRDFWRS